MCSAFSLDRFRRPEYTGENRCLPCTATNVGIAAVAGAVVALVWPPAGAGVLAFGLLAIYLRGYLVPGTPTFTRRYFPEPVLRAFDKADSYPTTPTDRPAADRPTEASEPTLLDDPEAVLSAADAVEPDPEADDLRLTPAFRTAWHERIDRIRTEGTEKRALQTLLGIDEAVHLDDENPDGVVMAHTETRPVGYWESRAAFLADLAAAVELSSRYDGWGRLPVEGRSQAVNGLRVFLDRCPTCGGEVVFGESTVRSCCRSHDVLAVSCVACGARILEVDAPEMESR
ncbi:hypothetical protein [Halococcus hamelinensis]|uniref:Uncharacterized protein n=1 Tax=Halococcus hamelinensis 100A6 TaxID=1132509 RepID=M0LY40_9EURY|nr:hypothetical protein [Halococcus hamelinensis]EMA38492.1 hypothetical protein C447_10067 [Halococcus hamelinensis 100A6]